MILILKTIQYTYYMNTYTDFQQKSFNAGKAIDI